MLLALGGDAPRSEVPGRDLPGGDELGAQEDEP
jgi:hypothetical protein